MKRLLAFLLPTILFAVPAQVILIRHGEIPEGTPTLSLKGRERAHAFVPFFQGAPDVNAYGLPVAIFVPKESPHCAQTMEPLSENIRVPVTKKYAFTQIDQLAKEIINNPDYEGHMILVCWPNSTLPELALKLGAKKAPQRWEDQTFDRLWVLTMESKEFKNLPQKILYGDSAK